MANAAAFLLYWWIGVPLTHDWIGVLRSAFFHVGAVPFCINILFLWLFGDNVEDQTGRGRFVILYLLSGISAALAHAALDPSASRTLIGASGAIGGVMGAYFVLYPHSRILVLLPLPLSLHELPAALFLGIWLVLQLLTVAGQVGAHPQAADLAAGLTAHAMGFATGALLCLAFRRPERARVEWWSP